MSTAEKPGDQPAQGDDPLDGIGSGDLGDEAFEAFLERMDQILSSMVGEE